jgi:hypothetical protein
LGFSTVFVSNHRQTQESLVPLLFSICGNSCNLSLAMVF